MFELAQRNKVLHTLPCKTLDEMRAAYNFGDLQSFLDLYYAGCAALICEQVCTYSRSCNARAITLRNQHTRKPAASQWHCASHRSLRLTLQCLKAIHFWQSMPFSGQSFLRPLFKSAWHYRTPLQHALCAAKFSTWELNK